jgi:hypothetical protein
MSNKYKTEKEVPTRVICDRLDELSNAVVDGREAINREFGMRIPAELDYDADLVLSTAAKRLREMDVENV